MRANFEHQVGVLSMKLQVIIIIIIMTITAIIIIIMTRTAIIIIIIIIIIMFKRCGRISSISWECSALSRRCIKAVLRLY